MTLSRAIILEHDISRAVISVT